MSMIHWACVKTMTGGQPGTNKEPNQLGTMGMFTIGNQSDTN